VQSDIDDSMQPREVSTQIEQAPRPLEARMRPGYHIEVDSIIECSLKANTALVPVFPAMLILALATPVFQMRLISVVIRAVDFARRDLTAREQRPEQHAGRLGAGRYALGLDAPVELLRRPQFPAATATLPTWSTTPASPGTPPVLAGIVATGRDSRA